MIVAPEQSANQKLQVEVVPAASGTSWRACGTTRVGTSGRRVGVAQFRFERGMAVPLRPSPERAFDAGRQCWSSSIRGYTSPSVRTCICFGQPAPRVDGKLRSLGPQSDRFRLEEKNSQSEMRRCVFFQQRGRIRPFRATPGQRGLRNEPS
jgi:hypothetical protein